MSPQPPQQPARPQRSYPDRPPRDPAEPQPAKVTPARRVAFEILTLVGGGKGHSDELLHSTRTAALSPEDRNLTTAIVMGVLRWQIALDAQIAALLSRPDQRVPAPVSIVLRMGAFQLLHLDRIPAHAALSESVELCRIAGQPQAAGMVNAVLRKLSVSKPPKTPIFESIPALATRLSHPEWLVNRWVAAYGQSAARAICAYDQQIPAAGGLFPPPDQPEDAGSTPPGDPLPQMDDGSRLVAELAAAAAPHTGQPTRVWDCCAAPGGKTRILAARLPYADILASDVSSQRLQQMEARLRAAPGTSRVRTAVLDAAAGPPAPQPAAEPAFDLILCDVPCSGTGTLARNPEIRLRLRPEELPRQAQRQRAILTHALRRLAPGGRLLYSTCSLEAEENEAVVLHAKDAGGYRTLPIEPLLQSLAGQGLLSPAASDLLCRSAVRNGTLRTLPGTHPCDGFFAVIFERE
ncbi:MAG: RNA methyltransferase [Acidobacteriota bacterium]|nr:RNA methyltransferase [Acidobacteriota bacterium]